MSCCRSVPHKSITSNGTIFFDDERRMQRLIHVLTDIDGGRAAELILPDVVSDAGAVIVPADDHAWLMLLNRIQPPPVSDLIWSPCSHCIYTIKNG